MPNFLHLSSRSQLVLRFTLIGGAIGAVYSNFIAVMRGDPLFSFASVPRCILTGALIGGVLVSFEVFVLLEPIGAPLRRLSFPVHVTIKTSIYLIVILCALALGAWAYPAPNE